MPKDFQKLDQKKKATLNKAVITGTIVATLTLLSSCNLVRKAVLSILEDTHPISKPKGSNE